MFPTKLSINEEPVGRESKAHPAISIIGFASPFGTGSF
jgi:hypothetical protein